MSREWQPGDVALVRNEYNVWNVAICAVRRGRRGFVWSYGVADSESPIEADARPLVVIDPEDREQVERLAKAYTALSSGFAELMDEPWTMPAMRMRQALREFADPKPEEPTGLGAVVRDADGRIYTRYEKSGPKHEPQPWWQSANGPEHDVVRRFGWHDIDAVEVLSEGVTP